ncbi:hypothetical protein ElyMa_005612800, partial [Elysia marginata]
METPQHPAESPRLTSGSDNTWCDVNRDVKSMRKEVHVTNLLPRGVTGVASISDQCRARKISSNSCELDKFILAPDVVCHSYGDQSRDEGEKLGLSLPNDTQSSKTLKAVVAPNLKNM